VAQPPSAVRLYYIAAHTFAANKLRNYPTMTLADGNKKMDHYLRPIF
jgi:hypothetical protein